MRALNVLVVGVALTACGGRALETGDYGDGGAPQNPIGVDPPYNGPTAPIGVPPIATPRKPPIDEPPITPPIWPAGPTSACVTIDDCAVEGGSKVSTYRAASPDGLDVIAIGVYETRSDHSYAGHPMGHASVSDTRSTPHVLLLAAYEPTTFEVIAVPGSGLTKVVLAGYAAHKANLPPGVALENRSGSFASFPYENTAGDAPDCPLEGFCKLSMSATGHALASFAGCYRATRFRVGNGACTGNSVPPPPPAAWEASGFAAPEATSGCHGARYVRYNERYSKWIGAVLCSPTAYKLYASEAKSGPFYPIADTAGHGQDHCELVSATFSLPNEDDVTSGACPSCSVTMAGWERPGAVPVYVRARFGEPLTLLPVWPEYNHYTSSSYSCGVSVP